MDVFQARLAEREKAADRLTEADHRWLQERHGVEPAERLILWDRWVHALLAKTLVWPADKARRMRLQGQCAAELRVMVRQLCGRGWLLDGDALAQHVRGLLAPIGQAQRAGKVGDFWPYFRAAVSRYVGANAEEIQLHARRTGADESTQAIGSLLAGVAARLRGPSMTELLQARAREISAAKADKTASLRARASAKQAACKAAASGQQDLF